MTDIIDDMEISLTRFTAEKINQLRMIINKRGVPSIRDALKNYTVFAKQELDKHVVSAVFELVTSFSFSKTETNSHLNEVGYIRKIPAEVLADSILYTPIGTFEFPLETRIFGGLTRLDGTQYYKLDPYLSSTQMDMGSSGFSISWNHKKTSSGTYGIFCKRDMSNTTNPGIEIWISGTTINLRIADGTNTVLLSATFANLNDGNRHTIVCNVPNSGNLEIFVDKVSHGTISRSLVGSVTNSRSAYIFTRDNAGVLQDKYVGDFAWISWKKEIMSSQDRIDFHDNCLLNYKTATDTEVLTIPFQSNTDPMPNCYEGQFIA